MGFRALSALKSKTVATLQDVLPLSVRIALVPTCPAIVFFHAVGDSAPYLSRTMVSEQRFRELIDELLQHFAPLEDLSPEGISGASSSHFMVSFDDGLRSAYEVAAPILEQKGIPAIFFINPDFMDGLKDFYRFEAFMVCERLGSAPRSHIGQVRSTLRRAGYVQDDPVSALLALRYPDRRVLHEIADILGFDMRGYFAGMRPYMSASECSDLLKRGFSLGAHSLDHPRFSEISLQAQVDETVASMERVRVGFNLHYRYFAFPFNDGGVGDEYYARTRDHVDCYFTTRGWRPPGGSPMVLHRVGMDRDQGRVGAIERLKSKWGWN